MPDANGRIPPVAYSLSTEQWERIFGKCEVCNLTPDEFCSEDDCPLGA